MKIERKQTIYLRVAIAVVFILGVIGLAVLNHGG